MKMKAVDNLDRPGKSYDLLYNGKRMVNVSLEAGDEMTKETAFDIINHTAREMGYAPRKYIDKVSWEETAEPINSAVGGKDMSLTALRDFVEKELEEGVDYVD